MTRNLIKYTLLASATLLVATSANAQDWSSASETFYFEYDKTLGQTSIDTTRLDEVIRSCNVNSINIVGHADTSGNAQYNEGLSLRRAEKIKSRLVANGFSANSITTRGAGENELAVLTGDGVKEQLNRRAEILFSFSEPCGLYYVEPVYVEPTYVEPTYVEPTYVEPTYVEPTYVQPAPAPEAVVTYQPAPAPAPTPVAAPAPTPVYAPAPVAPPVPAPVVSGGIPTGLFGAAALVGLGGAAFIIADGSDDDVPVSP